MQRETSGRGMLSRLAGMLRGNRRLEIAVYAGIVGIVALLYVSSVLPKRESAKTAATNAADAPVASEAALEEKLRSVLGCIRGAGNVEVMITYETGTELVTAMSTNVNSSASETSDGGKTSSTTQSTETNQPATVSSGGGNEPIVLMEKQPVVRGVIVVAEGAADIYVKLDLQRAVQAVLDIPLSRIEVFERAAAGND